MITRNILPADRQNSDLVNYMGFALLVVACSLAAYLGHARQCADTAAPLKAKPPITRTIAPTVMV